MRNYLKNLHFKLKANNGYTLIEMLVVIFIISLISGTTLYNYSVHKKDEILLAETQKIAQMLRRAQNLALSPQYDSGTINGFGVYLSTTQTAVTLFKDSVSLNNMYDGGSEKVEELSLSPEVKISVLEAPSGDGTTQDETALNILYIPPDPTMTIFNNSGNTNATDALIVVSLASDSAKKRTIKINLVGLVEVK